MTQETNICEWLSPWHPKTGASILSPSLLLGADPDRLVPYVGMELLLQRDAHIPRGQFFYSAHYGIISCRVSGRPSPGECPFPMACSEGLFYIPFSCDTTLATTEYYSKNGYNNNW